MLKFPDIDPVAFSIGPLQLGNTTLGPLDVHWYGIMYLVGFAGAWLLSVYRSRKPWTPIEAGQAEDLIFYSAIGLVVGARIGYVLFYNFEAWMNDLTLILRPWEGGMSFHGGLIGVALGLLLYARKIGRNFFDLVDFVAPFAPIGLFFGRIGNFIGGELFGRVTTLPWGVEFPRAPGEFRHPSQLYEAFLEGLVLFCILFWFSARPRPRGAVIGLFLVLYGVFRFSVEFVREPDAHIMFDMFGWMTRGQLLCVPMIVVGAALIVYGYRHPQQKAMVASDPGTADNAAGKTSPAGSKVRK